MSDFYDKLHEISPKHVEENMKIIIQSGSSGGTYTEYITTARAYEKGNRQWAIRARELVNAKLGKLGEEIVLEFNAYGPVIYVASLNTGGWRAM